MDLNRGLPIVQNVGAGAVKGADVMPLLCELHWLSVPSWAQFKVLVKALYDKGPDYLWDCISLKDICPSYQIG